MPAFFVATVSVKDADKFQDYAQKAGATFAAHGGELVLRGKAEAALAGALAHHAVGIVRFPNLSALQAWFQSEAYQALIPLRDAAADMTIIIYSAPG